MMKKQEVTNVSMTVPEQQQQLPDQLTFDEIKSLVKNGVYIAKGGYGRVWKSNFRGEMAIVKIARQNTTEIKESFALESSVLKKLDGAGGAPTLLAVSLEEPATLVQSLCGGKTYLATLYDEAFGDVKVFKALAKIALALDDIHQKGVIHNDVKTDNVLVDFNETGEAVVHIIDYGLSAAPGHFVHIGESDDSDSLYAPEIRIGGGHCSEKSDVFSFGVLIKDALTIRRGESAKNIPEVFELMSQKATQTDPELRPTLQEMHQVLSTAFCCSSMEKE